MTHDAPPSAAVTAASLKLAVIGAGPAGLALALLAARSLHGVQVTVFDARPADKDISADPRTLALSLGSVQLMRQLGVWPEAQAQPITEVHVSQAPPTLGGPLGDTLLRPEVRLTAAEQGVAALGAVLAYGQIVAPLQRAWQAECERSHGRHGLRLGTPVAGLKDVPGGVEVDAGIAETFDLVVIAEGGVFADQARKALSHDYRQTAWVGTVQLGQPTSGPAVAAGAAFERFTRHGPVALLPLPASGTVSAGAGAGAGASANAAPAASAGGAPGVRRASLVWCVPTDDDPVAALDAAQRRAVLATLLPEAAGPLLEVGPLKHFALGLNAETTLVAGRKVRIGNAAQTLHPVAGQGLNLGLRDAQALVRTLRDTPDLDAALRKVEWARAPDRWSMIATTDFLARSFTWQWPGLGALRGLGLAALQALPPVKGLLARQMMFGRR